MRLVHLSILVGAAVLALGLYRPPASVPASAPLEMFSAARAAAHLGRIASAPHPVGSENHARVRQYLVDTLTRLGLEPEVQRVSRVGSWRGQPVGATLHNVLARVPGTAGGRAVLVVAHYDSVPTSPGASDDGVGVAAMLEVARALRAGPPPRNDVLLLFSDGEELGLLGARAFQEEHPLARSVEVVLNFDARGTRGPSMMFETSGGDGRLIELLARTEHPIANSLAGEIYKLMPGDTDFSVFREAGLRGLNFAFIDRFEGYHTRLDTAADVDPDSLQHQGGYMLSLLRELGRADLSAPRAPERVYFNPLGAAFITYPVSWAVPLALLAGACCLAVLVHARRRGCRVRPGGVVLGVLACVCLVAVLAGAWELLMDGLQWLDGALRPLRLNHRYQHRLYLMGFTALALGVATGGGAVLRRWLDVREVAAGAQCVWAALAVLSAHAVPGASYLFTWPLLVSALGLRALTSTPRGAEPSHRAALVLTLSAVPTLFLLLPTLYALYVAMTLEKSAGVMGALGLVLALLLPQLGLIASRRTWTWVSAAALSGVGLVGLAWGTAAFDEARPRLDTLSYVVDADAGRADWVSFDPELDPWTGTFVDGSVRDARLLALLPGRPPAPFARAASPLAVPSPSLEVLDDSVLEGERRLRLLLRSNPGVVRLTFRVESPPARLVGTEVEGRALAAGVLEANGNALDYWAPPAGLEVLFRLRPGEPLRLRLIEQTFGLPLPEGRARPVSLTPAPDHGYGMTDSTFVSRAFAL